MTSIPTSTENAQSSEVGHGAGRLGNMIRVCLDALLTRRATRLWWAGAGCVVLIGLFLHTSAWMGIPTIATADTNAYCQIMHTMEAGQLPDLTERNIGYPLFMYVCKLVGPSLNRTLPLAQHLLEIAAAIFLMGWMRRNWGVLAGLMTGALLLVNAGRVIWTHYGHPNALLCSVVPMAAIVLMSYLVSGRRRDLLLAAGLWSIVMLTRDEVLLLALVIPAGVLVLCPKRRGSCLRWCGVVVAIVAVCGIARVGINYSSTGAAVYSTHCGEAVAWRGLHTKALVAPPRPERLETLYQAALSNGAQWRDGYLHYEDLWRAGRDAFGITRREALAYMADCSIECIRRRPYAYLSSVVDYCGRLWLHPKPGLEWEAFRKSDPEIFTRDASRLTWAHDSWAEFPITYETSGAQKLFRRLAVLRPGQTFAMKPLAVLFLVGFLCLLLGVGPGGHGLRRWWFVGMGAAVVVMTVFYAAIADVANRYRTNVEWAFFAVAVLGLVLPLHLIRRRLTAQGNPRGQNSRE